MVSRHPDKVWEYVDEPYIINNNNNLQYTKEDSQTNTEAWERAQHRNKIISVTIMRWVERCGAIDGCAEADIKKLNCTGDPKIVMLVSREGK